MITDRAIYKEEANDIMMASSKPRPIRDGSDKEFQSISEGDETKCSDDIWAYYEAHKDEAEDLDDYLRRRGIKVCSKIRKQ